MSFKQMMSDDLDIFYDSDEFAESAYFNGASEPITVLPVDDIEVSSSDHRVISAKVSDVAGIAEGNTFLIDETSYQVSNFDYKDSTNLEYFIALREV